MMISETKAFKLLRQGKELKPNKEEDQNQTKNLSLFLRVCSYIKSSRNQPPAIQNVHKRSWRNATS